MRRLFWISLGLLALVGSPTTLSAGVYETSLQVAEALDEIERLVEDLGIVLEIDYAETWLKTGPCKAEWDAFNGAVGGRTDQNRERLDRCVDQASGRNSSLNLYGLRSFGEMFERYNRAADSYRMTLARLRSGSGKNPHFGDLYAAQSATIDTSTDTALMERLRDGWLAKERELLERHDKKIAVLEPYNSVEVGRNGAWTRVTGPTDVRVFDSIRTGPTGRAKLTLLDLDPNIAGPTVLNIGIATEVALREFALTPSKKQRNLFVDLIKGVIRASTLNWSSGSSFAVRTGVSLCGIRGTEIDFHYDPGKQEVTYVLHRGEVEITPGLGSRFALGAGKTVTVTEGVAGPIRPIGRPAPLS